MKRLSLILLGMLIAFQITVPFNMIRSRENILRNGTLFKFKTRPIDPADPFQGRYVRLGIEQNYVPAPDKPEPDIPYKAPIYTTIETTPDGFARFTSWSLEKPTGVPFLKSRYLGPWSEWISERDERVYKGDQIDIPFDRYYMEETKAPRAEQLVREATLDTNCWVEVRIFNGKAVIEDVFAEGRSLRELAGKKSE